MVAVTRRSVTPIFAHDARGAQLRHKGTHRDVEFTVVFRPYLHSADDFNVITSYASPGVRSMLVESKMFFSEHMHGLATHVLIVDVRHDDGSPEATFSRFNESVQVHEAAISRPTASVVTASHQASERACGRPVPQASGAPRSSGCSWPAWWRLRPAAHPRPA